MKTILILHSDIPPNATQDELDCLVQAEEIARALRALRYHPVLAPFSLNLNAVTETITALKPAAVFNLVETVASTGRLIHFAPSLLDALNMPYTGCPANAVFQTSNKPLAKQIMNSTGIATPDWINQDGSGCHPRKTITYLIKSSWEHASIGLDSGSLVPFTTKAKLLKTMHHRKKNLGGSCFAEAYIEGREFNVALISYQGGVKILPVAEMLFQDYRPDQLRIVDYKAKWDTASFEYNNTVRQFDFAPKDRSLIKRLKEISLRCWNIFSLKGYARVDFRVDKRNKPWVLEINTNPCLSPDAGFAAALQQADIKYRDAIGWIIHDAMKYCRT